MRIRCSLGDGILLFVAGEKMVPLRFFVGIKTDSTKLEAALDKGHGAMFRLVPMWPSRSATRRRVAEQLARKHACIEAHPQTSV